MALTATCGPWARRGHAIKHVSFRLTEDYMGSDWFQNHAGCGWGKRQPLGRRQLEPRLSLHWPGPALPQWGQPTANSWNYVPGELNQIAVSANASVFASTRTVKHTQPGWMQIPGTLVQLSVGTYQLDSTTQTFNFDRNRSHQRGGRKR